ncbi:MAG: hypothetical protein EBT06_09945 [Gammaproteobacteria bacterium]|nr:hypothetical protein [Gammaproteobacteria bacterium]
MRTARPKHLGLRRRFEALECSDQSLPWWVLDGVVEYALSIPHWPEPQGRLDPFSAAGINRIGNEAVMNAV